MPDHQTKQFKTTDGGVFHYREWENAHSPDIVIYLHGLESHSGWFADAARSLTAKGTHVIGIDRRGSGLDKTNRGYLHRYPILLDDLKEFIQEIKQHAPDKKVYLMGICWGGKVAALFSAQYKDLIDGVIFVAPGIKTHVDLTLWQKLGVFLCTIFRPRKEFDVPLEDCMLTKSQKYLDFIKHDTLKLKKVTARFFWETGKINRHLNHTPSHIVIPVLMLLAGKDSIVNNTETKQWFDRISSKDKELKEYASCDHILFFEESIGSILDDIALWMHKHN